MTRDEALSVLASASDLLLMCDYDGTLTPITSHPALARPAAPTLESLAMLVEAPRTEVAVVSGRRRSDLEGFIPVDGVILVGGHGAETGQSVDLDEEGSILLRSVVNELEGIATSSPGTLVEVKQTSAALHYRHAEDSPEEILTRVMTGPARHNGVRVLYGKKVIELSVSSKDKGDAVRRLRSAHPTHVACFIGDDVTDEDAFRALEDGDVGIKVGDGATAAEFRLATQDEVVPLLAEVAFRRS
jgi:trehalose 6-phosphate phosphatase